MEGLNTQPTSRAARLGESSSLGLMMAEHAPSPMAMVRGADHILSYVNPVFCRLLRKSSDALVGMPFHELLPQCTECMTLLDRVFRTGSPESHTEQDDSQAHPVFWSFTMWPVSEENRTAGVMIQVTETAQFHEKTLAMNEALIVSAVRQHELSEAAELLNRKLQTEISERKEVENALRESEERFRTLFELGPVAVYSCDALGMIQNYNHRAAELWGREPGITNPDERFCGSFKMFRPDGGFLPHDQCPMADVVAGRLLEVRDGEVCVERADGSRLTVLVNILPLKDQRGNVMGAINCFYDITERKRAEQRQALLTHELAHRGKNLLAVVQSIASRSLAGTRSLLEAREVLIQRLHALARGQTVLIAGGFEGAALGEIITLECETFSDRVTVLGPPVILKRRITQTFVLLVHELATNAIKHGALSVPEGKVAINWSIEGSGPEARFTFRMAGKRWPASFPSNSRRLWSRPA